MMNQLPLWFVVGAKIWFRGFGPETQILAINSDTWIGQDLDGQHFFSLKEIEQWSPSFDGPFDNLGVRMHTEEDKTPEITFTDFLKVDLRTGTIRSAERIAKSDKLLKLQVDFGPLGMRQIVAGIGKHFTPEQLKDARIVAVVNLQPRKLMGLESHGMILAVGGENNTLNLITTSHDDVLDGSKIG